MVDDVSSRVQIDPSEINISKNLPIKTSDLVLKSLEGSSRASIFLDFPKGSGNIYGNQEARTCTPQSWFRPYPVQVGDWSGEVSQIVILQQLLGKEGYCTKATFPIGEDYIRLDISRR